MNCGDDSSPTRAVVVTATSHPDAEAFDADSELVVERIPARTLFLPTWRAKRFIESAIERHHPDLVLLDPAWPLGLTRSETLGSLRRGRARLRGHRAGTDPDRGVLASLRA